MVWRTVSKVRAVRFGVPPRDGFESNRSGRPVGCAIRVQRSGPPALEHWVCTQQIRAEFLKNWSIAPGPAVFIWEPGVGAFGGGRKGIESGTG